MKGLLLKDAYLLVRQSKIFLLLIVVFAVLQNESTAGFAIVYAAMLPITALAYDERAKWDSLAAMMPYTPRSLVLSKYLLGYIAIAGAALLSAAAKLAVSAFRGVPPEPEALPAIALIACVACILLSINLPAMYRLGVERGRIVFLVLVAAFVVAAAAFGGKAATLLGALTAPMGALLAAAAALTALINWISVRLSMRFYRQARR